MQVWALRNLDGTFRGKLHRHDSYDCKGRRMYEENYADRGDYVLVDLRSLPGRQGRANSSAASNVCAMRPLSRPTTPRAGSQRRRAEPQQPRRSLAVSLSDRRSFIGI